MKKTLITASDIVVRRRGKAVLDSASLSVERGEIVALIGANGVGKTTLFNVIAGHLQPDSGRVDYGCPRERIALLADKPALYPDWSVNEALQRLARLYQTDSRQIDGLVETFGLGDVLEQKARNLSHGYRQRLAMAQMLLAEPEVMLLDEPGNGLDYRQRQSLWPLLDDLKSRGAVMLVSHDWTEVAAVADRVCLLKAGHCHLLDMPERNDDWRWLGFADAAVARQSCPQALCYDGRFVAIMAEGSYDASQVLSVSSQYPPQALQEKIDALA